MKGITSLFLPLWPAGVSSDRCSADQPKLAVPNKTRFVGHSFDLSMRKAKLSYPVTA